MLTTTGFFGTIDHRAEARRMARLGPRFRVDSPSDWKPSVITTAARTVDVAAGSGSCCGVSGTETAATRLTFDDNPSTTVTRVDAIVARTTWLDTVDGNGKTLSTMKFVVVKGTGANPAPFDAGVADDARINRLPGIKYDGLIAFVYVRPGVGSFAATDLKSVLPVGGAAGALQIPQGDFYTFVDVPYNGELQLAGSSVLYRRGPNGILPTGGVASLLATQAQNTTNGGGPLRFHEMEADSIGLAFQPGTANLSVPADGLYEVSGGYALPGATVSTFLDAYARRGVTYVPGGARVVVFRPGAPSAPQPPGLAVGVTLPPRRAVFSAGQQIGLWAYTDGSAQGVMNDGALNAWLTISRLG